MAITVESARAREHGRRRPEAHDTRGGLEPNDVSAAHDPLAVFPTELVLDEELVVCAHAVALRTTWTGTADAEHADDYPRVRARDAVKAVELSAHNNAHHLERRFVFPCIQVPLSLSKVIRQHHMVTVFL